MGRHFIIRSRNLNILLVFLGLIGVFKPGCADDLDDHTNITICPNVTVGQDAAHPAGAGIQKCIDSTPAGGVLALPVGTYYLEQQLFLRKAITLTTKGAYGSPSRCYNRPANFNGNNITLYDSTAGNKLCATIRAIPNFQSAGPSFVNGAMLFAGSDAATAPITGVVIDHLIIDANRAGRTAANLNYCNQNFCHNLHLYRCDQCAITNNVFDHALNGYNTLAIDTDALKVTNNLFWDSGSAGYVNQPQNYYRSAAVVQQQSWSNSFEVQANDRDCHALVVQGNDAVDSSDGSYCFAASGRSGRLISGDVSGNYVAQINNQNWQAIVLWDTASTASLPPTNMGDGGLEDPTKTLLIHDNVINCNAGGVNVKKCSFGIEVGGQHETPTDGHLSGARIHNNTVMNARVGINVDGAGINAVTPKNLWVSFWGNRVSGSGVNFNVAPESGNNTLNQEYNAIAAETAGADGVQVNGSLGFYGSNLTPPGWSFEDTSKACAIPGTTTLVPGVFGTCAWFPKP